MGTLNKPNQYFDSPDGHDVAKKLMVALKPTALTALAVATCDVMLYSHPKGYLKTLGRYAYVSLPIIGMGTAFVLTSNLVGSLRKEDDEFNWALGGLAAGGVLGAWQRTHPGGWVAGAALAAAAAGVKYANKNGYHIVPPEMKPGDGLLSRHDFTLTKDNPGAWKKT